MPRPKNTDKIMQILRLIRYLRHSGYVHRDQIMADLDLTPSQLKQQLDDLNFEIESGDGKGYFGSVQIEGGMTPDAYDDGEETGLIRLEEGEEADLRLTELFRLSQAEVRTLAISILSLIYSNSLNDEWTKVARDTFTDLVQFFDIEIPEAMSLGDEDSREDREQDILETLTDAASRHVLVHLKYQNASGQVTERDVKPLLVHQSLGYWILEAYCLLRDDYREFEVANILDLKVLERSTFEPIERAPSSGKDSVTLVLTKKGRFLTKELPAVEEKSLSGGRTELTIRLYGTEWFWRTLLEIAPYVESVTPSSHALPAVEEAKRALKLYSK